MAGKAAKRRDATEFTLNPGRQVFISITEAGLPSKNRVEWYQASLVRICL
jgi:hypothetical protein